MSKTILETFDETVQTIPQAVYNSQAFVGNRAANFYKEDNKWRTITYNEMVYKVENIAIGLIKLGIQAGDLIGIKAVTSPRWVWADLGSLFIGAATVSIYPTLSTRETTVIVNHSEVKAVFVDTTVTLYEMMRCLGDMPSIKYLICMQKGFKGDGHTVFGLGELMYSGSQDRATWLPEVKKRIAALGPDSNATMVYTSGTTGNMKGVMHTHKGILYSCTRSCIHYYNHGHIEGCDGMFHCVLPLSHIMEKVHSYFTPLILGSCIGFGQSPSTLLEDYSIIRPSFEMLVPRILSRFYLGFTNAFSGTPEGKKLWDWAMDVAERATYALEDANGNIDTTIPYDKQLTGTIREEWIKANDTVYRRIHHVFGGQFRNINCGGAYLDPEIHRKFVGMGFFIGCGYGLTETGSGIAECPPDATKIGWISPPNPGVEVKLDEDGELLLRGNGIITKYYKNEAADAECFTPDGWLRTGDIGDISADGYIKIVDRKKAIIVLDTGKNVAGAKLESLCNNCGLIDQVVILGQDRKFVSALIVPSFEPIVRVLKSQGVPIDESQLKYGNVNGIETVTAVGYDVIKNYAVQSILKAEINKINAQVEHYEQIRTFRLLNRRLSEEEGEITPTSKIKMRVVENEFRDLIESMYAS